MLVLGRKVRIERRRYKDTTYTWAYYNGTQLGDPWPEKPTLHELEEALRDKLEVA